MVNQINCKIFCKILFNAYFCSMENAETYTPPLPSEEEVKWVRLLATGEKAKGVAEKLGLNKNTFAYKLQLLRAKFNCKNTTQLVSYFITNKYID